MTGQLKTENPETSLLQALIPVVVLTALIVYGLILRPLAFEQPQLPLEIVFILAATATVLQLLLTGHRWPDIQDTIIRKFQKALPAFFILFCIGMVDRKLDRQWNDSNAGLFRTKKY